MRHARGPHSGSSLAGDIKSARHVIAATFMGHVRRIRKREGYGAARAAIFAISLRDIERALSPKRPRSRQELLRIIPPRFHDLLPLFMKWEADKLNPHKPGIDHQIPFKKGPDGQDPPVPYGALYGMSREELLVLRKTLNDLLDKGFIRASSSEAAAPVLFVRKPGGGLRFCCDYRALNAITKADRYPIPLIGDTLRNLAKARWFTKLDVV